MSNIPEGFELLGTIGYKDCGDYDASTTYNQMYVVRYDGSLYVALKDNLIGVAPSNDGTNWRLFLEGFPDPATGNDVEVTDTYGMTETSPKPDGGGTKKTLLQTLLDGIAKVAVKAITSDTFQNALKTYTVNGGTANVEGLVLDARQGNDSIDGTLAKRVKTNEESITELNSNIAAIFPGRKNVKILSFGDRYCKITAPDTSSNWGTILIASSNGFLVVGVSNNSEPVIIDVSDNNSIAVNTNGLTTTIDVGNDFSHSLVLIGGSLGAADISFE